MDRPEDRIEGLLHVISSSIGHKINDVYRGNNSGALKDLELNDCHAPVKALVDQQSTDSSSRVKEVKSFMDNLAGVLPPSL